MMEPIQIQTARPKQVSNRKADLRIPALILCAVVLFGGGLAYLMRETPSETIARQVFQQLSRNPETLGISIVGSPIGVVQTGVGGRPQRVNPAVDMKLSIKNASNKPIKSLKGRLQFIEHGRSVPFLEEGFSIEFVGGLEPSETKTESIFVVSNHDDAWNLVKNKAIWQVCIDSAEGPEYEKYTLFQGFVPLKTTDQTGRDDKPKDWKEQTADEFFKKHGLKN